MAQSISPVSIAINQLWNFFYIELGVFFFYGGASEFMDRVWMPFFAWVVVAAALESRLFIHVWRAQRAHRRAYDWRRLMHKEWLFTFILCVIGALSVIFQGKLLHNTKVLLLLNSTLWIPQIIHTFVKRSRRGPPLHLCTLLSVQQCFIPVYFKIDQDNMLDLQTDPSTALIMVSMMAL